MMECIFAAEQILPPQYVEMMVTHLGHRPSTVAGLLGSALGCDLAAWMRG
jgi:hypothetical protein